MRYNTYTAVDGVVLVLLAVRLFLSAERSKRKMGSMLEIQLSCGRYGKWGILLRINSLSNAVVRTTTVGKAVV